LPWRHGARASRQGGIISGRRIGSGGSSRMLLDSAKTSWWWNIQAGLNLPSPGWNVMQQQPSAPAPLAPLLESKLTRISIFVV